MAGSSEPRSVAEQAAMVAAAWSPAGAPRSWRLTAALFETLRRDEELLAIAAAIPADKLPPLLFVAAATFLVLEMEPEPLRGSFPRVGAPQPPLDPDISAQFRDFCLDQRDRLGELCARHRYQMNEVGRCAEVVLALAPVSSEGREVALIDLGTGAGLGLHLDRYRYLYRSPDGHRAAVGDPGSSLAIEVEARGGVPPPVPAGLPRVVDRVGIDIEPLDLSDAGVRAWLAACIPPEIGAVTRFHEAAEIAARHPARAVRGDAREVLPRVLDGVPADALPCLVDSYVHVFFPPDDLARFRELLDRLGAERDFDWISLDPLVPMGPDARDSVAGIAVPEAIVNRNRREGVFGVLTRLSYRGGRRTEALLALAHPGAAWLEWLRPGAP